MHTVHTADTSGSTRPEHYLTSSLLGHYFQEEEAVLTQRRKERLRQNAGKRNLFQVKEQDNTTARDLGETDINNMPDG